MTVTLKLGADPRRRDEQDNLPAAVAVLTPGETLSITPGTWPGDVKFPSQANVVGSGRDNTTLPGKLEFLGGGNIQSLDLPKGSQLIYGNGGGVFRDLYMDGDAQFTGVGLVTGSDVLSRTETGTLSVTPGAGVSLNLANVTLGPMALGGLSNLINSAITTLTVGGGVVNIVNVAVGTTVAVAAGQLTATNVTIGQSVVLQPGGAMIIPRNVVIS